MKSKQLLVIFCITTITLFLLGGFVFAQTRPISTISELKQYKSDGVMVIEEGDTINEDIVVFKSKVESPSNNQVKLQVELRQFNEPFNENDPSGIIESGFVNSGTTITLQRGSLTDGQYKWRARATDSQGNQSEWQEYGIQGNVDFKVLKATTIKVAVILAEPYDVPHVSNSITEQPCKLISQKTYANGHNKEYFEDLAYCVKDYYRENSYGKINLDFTIIDDSGSWFYIATSSQNYGDWGDQNEQGNVEIEDYDFGGDEFVRDVVNQASNSVTHLNSYEIVGVVRSGIRQTRGNFFDGQWHPYNQAWPWPTLTDQPDGTLPYKFIVGDDNFTGSWAHEIAHILGTILTGGPMCDLYTAQAGYCGGSNNDSTAIDSWDMMAFGSINAINNDPSRPGTNPSGLSSFSRNRLDWLGEEPIHFGNQQIESLETMKYGDNIKRYETRDNSYYLFETRTKSSQFSAWDTSLATNALVIYKINQELIDSTPTPIINLIKALDVNSDLYKDVVGKFVINTRGAEPDTLNKRFKTNIDFNYFWPHDYYLVEIKPSNSLLKKLWDFTGSYNETLENWLGKAKESITTDELLLSTDKTHYLFSEFIWLNVMNNTSQPIWYSAPYFLERKDTNGNWELVSEWMDFPAEFVVFKKLDSHGTEKKGESGISPTRFEKITKPGIYRMVGEYSFQKPANSTDWSTPNSSNQEITPRITYWTRSNEFTVDFSTASAYAQNTIFPTIAPAPSVSTSGVFLHQLAQTAKTPVSLALLVFIILTLAGCLALAMRIKKISSQNIDIIKLVKAQRIATAVFLILILLWLGYLVTATIKKSADIPISYNPTHNSLMASALPTVTALHQQPPPSFLEFIPGTTYQTLDLDLHAITPDGKHVGMNYQTNKYENQIPGAIVSGDLVYDDEWIAVPEGTEVKYYISSYDIQQYIQEHPEALDKLQTTTENYDFSAIYYDSQSNKFTSPTIINQQINPGQDIYYELEGTDSIKAYKTIDIDIKPGSYPNSINLKSKGLIPVAILTTSTFDVKDVNVNQISFARAEPIKSHIEDMDNDGDIDLILYFDAQSLNLNQQDTEASLTGDIIKGTDSVKIVPNKKTAFLNGILSSIYGFLFEE